MCVPLSTRLRPAAGEKVIVASQAITSPPSLPLPPPLPAPLPPSSLKRNDMHPDFLNGANQPTKESFRAPDANMA